MTETTERRKAYSPLYDEEISLGLEPWYLEDEDDEECETWFSDFYAHAPSGKHEPYYSTLIAGRNDDGTWYWVAEQASDRSAGFFDNDSGDADSLADAQREAEDAALAQWGFDRDSYERVYTAG